MSAIVLQCKGSTSAFGAKSTGSNPVRTVIQLFSYGTELLRDGPLSVMTQEVGELCHRNIVSESESQVSIFAIEPVAIYWEQQYRGVCLGLTGEICPEDIGSNPTCPIHFYQEASYGGNSITVP